MVNIQRVLLGSNYCIIQLNMITVNPPIPPLSGMAKNVGIGKTGKEVIYDQENPYSGPKSAAVLGERRYWGTEV